jgi:hypothetical protein
VRLRLPLDFCRSLKACQTSCLLRTSGADFLEARATLGSKHSTDLGQVHTPLIPERKKSNKIPCPSWSLGFLALVRMHRIPGLFWSSYRPFSFLFARPLNTYGCCLVRACYRTYLTHRKIIGTVAPASTQANTLITVARISARVIKGSPTSSIHNFSLRNSGLPGSAMNPWTTGAWSSVVTRSAMTVTQPTGKMMNNKARMMENLDISVNKVWGKGGSADTVVENHELYNTTNGD